MRANAYDWLRSFTLLLSLTSLVSTAGAVQAGAVATEISGFQDNFYVTSLAFNFNGTNLATNFSQQLDIHIWEWRGRSHIIRTLQKPPYTGSADLWDSLRYSADGHFLAIAHERTDTNAGGSYIQIWNAGTWAIDHDISQPHLAIKAGGVAFAPDSRHFVHAVEREADTVGDPPYDAIIVYSTKSWTPEFTVPISPLTPGSLALSPDGHFAAIGGTVAEPNNVIQSRIVIVDLTIHEIVQTINPFPAQCLLEHLTWSGDGTRIASGGLPFLDGCALIGSTVRVFDAKTGKAMSSDQSSGNAHIVGLQYTSDGKYLIEGGLHESVRIWDAAQKTLQQTIAVAPTALAVSNDDHYLAIAAGKAVSIWRLK